jgi:hypothetical protein
VLGYGHKTALKPLQQPAVALPLQPPCNAMNRANLLARIDVPTMMYLLLLISGVLTAKNKSTVNRRQDASASK